MKINYIIGNESNGNVYVGYKSDTPILSSLKNSNDISSLKPVTVTPVYVPDFMPSQASQPSYNNYYSSPSVTNADLWFV